jgi:alkylhydroperoxidase/carboxymuconolactone decarboxylase family protein YurZ
VRLAAAAGKEVPEPLAALVDKVHRHAYKVTEADIQGALRAGYSEDQIFELTVAAAFGAAMHRLETALRPMTKELTDATEESGTRP